ncbi:MAG: hypothetical protein IJ991_18765 [Thermoguttaceae bacterium]|nr:hypothetical protein [Thermoguttaceae bacterium]
MGNRTNNPRWKNETNERRARRFENGAENLAAARKFGRLAKRALVAILLAGAFDGGTLLAQSIINETSVFNNRFENFSSGSVEKIARLDDSAAVGATKALAAPSGSLSPSNKVDLRLDAPKGAPRENVGARLRVPFTFPKDADSKSATSVELFCSPDEGATWYSYAGQRPEDGAEAFVFQAPKPGVYWFALRTRFANGTAAFSSTRAYRFVEAPSTPTGDWANTGETGAAAPSDGATALTDSENAAAPTDSFALNDDSAETDAPPLGTPSAAAASETGGRSNKLLDLARGTANGEKTSGGKEGAETSESAAPTQPATGKIKSVGPAKEKGTDRLILILRWFRPSEIEEEARRGRPATIAVERGPSLDGPWTRVGEDLDSEREWFFWYATDAETTPFYVRTVATDDEGNQWFDAIPQPLDLSASWVQAALGSYKGPKFNVKKPSGDGTGDAKDSAENADADAEKSGSVGKLGSGKLGGGNKRLIRNAASSTDSGDAEDADLENGNGENENGGDSTEEKTSAQAKKGASTKRAQANAARRPRPKVPAPTNPNEFSLNPLFTQGFGVLFQAAQTRRGDGESDANRSIFTPPHRAPAASRVAPATYANASASAARRRAAAQAQDMSRYEKTPELMEGMVFYQDADGKLTTTPPADFQTAGVEGAIGGSFDASYPGGVVGGAAAFGTGADGRPLVLPGDNETYDANPNSAAATLTNPAYPNAAPQGVSSLNNWSAPSTGGYPANAVPSGSYPGNAVPSGVYPPSANYQTIPETSFGRNVLPGSTVGGSNASTWNAPTNAGTSSRTLFPPRPSVSR